MWHVVGMRKSLANGVPMAQAFRMRTATIARRAHRERERLQLIARAISMGASGEARQIREASGLSLTPLARAAGVSVPALSRWERGLARPSGDEAVRWVHALDDLATLGGGDAA